MTNPSNDFILDNAVHIRVDNTIHSISTRRYVLGSGESTVLKSPTVSNYYRSLNFFFSEDLLHRLLPSHLRSNLVH